jgi:autotransporter-associated beta strand protein
MGWSTWSFVRTNPTEMILEAQALALHNSGLQSHGFTNINVDDFYYLNPAQTADQYGRWAVDSIKFPNGIAAVAAYVHGLGLKFGIYMTPGIPVAAYSLNTPIQGTTNHAQNIVSTTSSHEVNYNYGNSCMYYIDYTKPGAQAFINSWANLLASWGVDYIKIDGVGDGDISDIEAWSQALNQTGRPMHLELSNSLDVNNGNLWRQYANGWRIEGDVECYCSTNSYPLTDWANVAARFSDAPKWTQCGGPGGWNDLDSLEIGNGTNNGLTVTERQSAMTLWCLCCSPLILGTDLTALDTNDLAMLFNDHVLRINQAGSIGAPLTYNTTTQIWRAAEADGSYAVAFFNLGSTSANVSVTWAQLGFTNAADVQDLWSGTDWGLQAAGWTTNLPSHGSALYRIAPLYPATRFLAAAAGNLIAGGATTSTVNEASGGVKVGSLGNGGTLTFNNVTAPAAGSYNLTFFYENGDTNRVADISINGAPATAFTFNTSGSWSTLASQTINVSLQAGINTVAISNPSGYAPDFDSLVIQSAVIVAPASPTGVTVTSGSAQATLSWLAVCGATGYKIKYGTTSGIYTATNVASSAGITNLGLINGQIYYFAVSATNSMGESGNSTEVSALAGSPAAPPGLNANAGNAQTFLSWNPSSGATSYNLKRSTTNGGPYAVVASLMGTNYTDISVVNGTTYYYVVSAVNGAGEGANSAQASATPILPNGTYTMTCQIGGLLLDDRNGRGNGTTTDQQPYTGTNQQWTATAVGGGWYEITAANGYALAGPIAGAELFLNSDTGVSNQLWMFLASGSCFHVCNAGTGQLMDDANGSTTAGTTVGQSAASGGAEQNWILTPVRPGPATLIWKGDGVTNNWDVQQTTNWLNGANQDVFFQEDTVLFDDTGSDSPAINLTAALSPQNVIVNAAQNYTFGGTGQLAGTMTLTKNGTGTLFLTGSNTFTGGTVISNGTLLVNGSINGVTVSPTGILGGAGTINGTATVQNGGTIQGGDANGSNTLTVTTLNLGDRGTATSYSRFTVAAGGNIAAVNLTVNGTNIINILDSNLSAGTYTLIMHGNAIGGSGSAGFKLGLLPTGTSAHLLDSGSALQLVVVPAVPAFSGIAQLADNNIQLIFNGANGQNYTVRASTNLTLTPVTNWLALGGGTFSNAPVTFVDMVATNFPERFYIITSP